MTGPRAGRMLCALVIAAGIGWSLLFVVVGLRYALQTYGDGAMFSYAVAVQDVWAFHWHNVSGRLAVWLLCLLPAEVWVGLTGSPQAGIVLYGLLWFAAPILGLIATFAADRSPGRVVFVYACASTACVLPLVFGFPTEMWLAHALFWPTLALARGAPRGVAATALVFVLMVALVLTHEGALVLAAALVSALLLRGPRDHGFVRAAAAFAVALAIWTGVKLLLPPDDYYAIVIVRAAWSFFDPAILNGPLVRLLLVTLAAYALVLLLLHVFARRLAPMHAGIAAGLLAVGLAVYWGRFDHAVHAENRYYLRTAIVLFTPVFGWLAMLQAWRAEDGAIAPLRVLARAVQVLAGAGTARIAAGTFILVLLVHAVETAKFVNGWTRYRAAVQALATGAASDPELGDPRFVSSERIDPALNPWSWFSTTQYLSAIVADFTPTRLVIDPKGNYFWLSCATASANLAAPRAVPSDTRRLVRIHACQHR